MRGQNASVRAYAAIPDRWASLEVGSTASRAPRGPPLRALPSRGETHNPAELWAHHSFANFSSKPQKLPKRPDHPAARKSRSVIVIATASVTFAGGQICLTNGKDSG